MRDYISEFETYLQENKKSSQNTVVSYLRDISAFNSFEYGAMKKDILKCTERDIVSYIDHLREGGKSDSTITRILASLRSFYTLRCYEQGYKG